MVTIEVYANTGHQYHSVPLADLMANTPLDKLDGIVNRNRSTEWKRWDRYVPWVLYRYGWDENASGQRSPGRGVPVIHLSVETNLGLPDRGFLLDVAWPEGGSAGRDDDEEINSYAATDESDIAAEFDEERYLMLDTLPEANREIELRIQWNEPLGHDPIDVDLIVDMGNTRSLALLLESPGKDGEAFARRAHLVRFVPRGRSYFKSRSLDDKGMDDCSMIDSWLLLNRTQFDHMEPPLSEEKLIDREETFKGEDGQDWTRVCRYLPHAFVELSPALVGGGSDPEGAAKTYAGIAIENHHRFSWSSPKRYAWDDRQRGSSGDTFWMMLSNIAAGDEAAARRVVKFRGLIQYLMDPGGVHVDLENLPDKTNFIGMPSPSAAATFPTSNTICWFALAIIETAYRQINARKYLEFVGRDSLPRRLKNVYVTYPSGWTYDEKHRYLKQWQLAIDLFALTRFENLNLTSDPDPDKRGDRPRLIETSQDEAVCSQLAVIYSQLQLLSDGKNAQRWFQLFGKYSADEERGWVDVMNIDIGGGTTDIAIIRYERKSGDNNVYTELKYRDGQNLAGDEVVRKLIENLIIPSWMELVDSYLWECNPTAKEWMYHLFRDPDEKNRINTASSYAKARMIRILRLLLIPLANKVLSELCKMDSQSAKSINIKLDDPSIDVNALRELNEMALRVIIVCSQNHTWGDDDDATSKLAEEPKFRRWLNERIEKNEVPFPYLNKELVISRADVEGCIHVVFKSMIHPMARLVNRFNCDMVIVSGKPSELPYLQRFIRRSLPLLPQRIIFVKNFQTGSWCPFTSPSENRIEDAKTCTVVGAALYQDMLNGNSRGVAIINKNVEEFSKSYYWGIMSDAGRNDSFYKRPNLVFDPSELASKSRADPEDPSRLILEKTIEMPLNGRIGRKLANVANTNPDPVYKLAWDPVERDQQMKERDVEVKLRWASEKGKGEYIELIDIQSKDEDFIVTLEDGTVHWELNTLMNDTFWLDDPSFQVAQTPGPPKI